MGMLTTRSAATEQMDAIDLDPVRYARVIADLERVNRVTMAARPTLRFLDQLASGRKPLRILDVGFGNGDMLRRVWHWSVKRGVDTTLVGIDLNPSSMAPAQGATPVDAPITYRIGDYAALASEPWDVVISSLVTHHMTDQERRDFVLFMDKVAKRGWFINDLHRHGFAYHGYPILARMMGVDRIVREDGQLSIARSFRPPEWAAMLAALPLSGAILVQRQFPFRLCVSCIR
jgi:SAM-dependent methyltransferase